MTSDMADLSTVHYVTQDPLSNLKLRVTLTLLSAARPRAAGQDQEQNATSRTAAAEGQDASAASATSAPAGRPAPFKVSRTFAWQEKVYSKAELVSAQAQIRANQQQGVQMTSPRRTAHFGSQSHLSPDSLTASPDGSILFSYVQTDQSCEDYETSKKVTTSKWEGQNHLARKLATDARNRQKMLNFQSMFIMADLGDEATVAGSNEKILCVIRAHHDGSFDMTPGFSTDRHRYRFEDDHGGIFEYSLELASYTSAPSLEKRAAKLANAVAAQAEELRKQHSMDKLPVPGPDSDALRLVLLAELVSAAGFERDKLYVEWQLHFNPDLWILQHSEQEVAQPGLIQGVTHVSQMVQYPADPSTDTPVLWVAHFAHPIEVEWVARSAPAPKDWPRLLLQVCTYDLWDRVTTEGYGWLQLGPATCSSSCTQYVDTWRPLGSRRDQQQAYFIGGTEELQDLSYIACPKTHKGTVLNKYGYKTQTSGNVKVRTHMVLQAGAGGGSSPRKEAAARGAAVAAAARQRRSLSLAVVLERARSRLQEARGGEVVVRKGLLVQPPTITAHPADITVNEGGTVQLSITAVGLGPLRYQWYRDSKRLTVATSNSPLLVLVDVAAGDSGAYHCQVSNKDGSCNSNKALLTIVRVGRLQTATASTSGGTVGRAAEPSSSGEAASQEPSLSSTLARRTTVPRSLPLGGGRGLPFSLRTGQGVSNSGSTSGTISSPSTRAGILSPLRTPLALASRPASAAGSLASASGAAAAADSASEGAPAVGGAVRGWSAPARRFAARPSTSPASNEAAAETAATTAAGGPERAGNTRASGGWFGAAEAASSSSNSSKRTESHIHSAAVDDEDVPHQQPGQSTGPASSTSQPAEPLGLPREGSSSSQGVSSNDVDDVVRAETAAAAESSVGSDAAGSNAGVSGSPARLGSLRRTRVSEQQ